MKKEMTLQESLKIQLRELEASKERIEFYQKLIAAETQAAKDYERNAQKIQDEILIQEPLEVIGFISSIRPAGMQNYVPVGSTNVTLSLNTGAEGATKLEKLFSKKLQVTLKVVGNVPKHLCPTVPSTITDDSIATTRYLTDPVKVR